MTTIDHERCSELLSAFIAGELSNQDHTAVRDHLAGCEACRAEKAGLEALRAQPDAALSEDERTRLHTGVMAAIESTATVIPMPPKRTFGSYAARFLGAAAAITAIATFVYFGVLDGSGEDLGVTSIDGGDGGALFDEDTAGEEAPEAAADSDAGGGRGADTSRKSKGEKGTTAAMGTTFDSAQSGGGPRPPFAIASEPFTSAQLQELGASSEPSRTFANYYNQPDDAQTAMLLDQLVDEARDQAGEDVAQQIEDCSTPVLDSEDTIVTTFGAIGELDGQDVLVVGFAWARSGGPLDSYMVWAWERGDCNVTLEYIEGRIQG